MIRLIVRTVVYLISAAVGLIVASLVFTDFNIQLSGFIVALVVFCLAQLVLGPFIFTVVRNNANAFLGGVGLLSTFVALLFASFLGKDGLTITGIGTWIGATVIVWLVTAVATMIVPFLLVKAGWDHAREARQDNSKGGF